MKRLLVAFTLLFVSLNFIACSQKKENKTRLTQGAGRTSGVTGTPTSNGWVDLNQGGPQQVYLTSQDDDASARAFLSTDDGSYGYFEFNSVVMRLTFRNGQVVPQNSRLGLRFWDSASAEPMSYYVGPEMGATVSGSKNGNLVRVVFNDGGDITVQGTVSNGTFSGKVTYDGGKFLGNFSVPAANSIFGY